MLISRIEAQYGVRGSSLADRRLLKDVCAMVIDRAAKLTAVAVASTLRHIGDRGTGSTPSHSTRTVAHSPAPHVERLRAEGNSSSSH